MRRHVNVRLTLGEAVALAEVMRQMLPLLEEHGGGPADVKRQVLKDWGQVVVKLECSLRAAGLRQSDSGPAWWEVDG